MLLVVVGALLVVGVVVGQLLSNHMKELGLGSQQLLHGCSIPFCFDVVSLGVVGGVLTSRRHLFRVA